MFSRGLDNENWFEISFEKNFCFGNFFFILFFFFLINHGSLGETFNQQIYNEVASYFCESFALVFIGFGFKLHMQHKLILCHIHAVLLSLVRFLLKT